MSELDFFQDGLDGRARVDIFLKGFQEVSESDGSAQFQQSDPLDSFFSHALLMGTQLASTDHVSSQDSVCTLLKSLSDRIPYTSATTPTSSSNLLIRDEVTLNSRKFQSLQQRWFTLGRESADTDPFNGVENPVHRGRVFSSQGHDYVVLAVFKFSYGKYMLVHCVPMADQDKKPPKKCNKLGPVRVHASRLISLFHDNIVLDQSHNAVVNVFLSELKHCWSPDAFVDV